MKAATAPTQRPAGARLLVVDGQGALHHAARSTLPQWLRPGDLLVANDAATLPASLRGIHAETGREVELRLAGWGPAGWDEPRDFIAVLFGEGDHRTPTEHRPAPPSVAAGDLLLLGPLRGRVTALLGHPRLLRIAFEGEREAAWQAIAAHGHPIQYAHMHDPLALWDVWTPLAALPVAFEPPSAGFALDWGLLAALKVRGVGFATLTHAAGISSTGDDALDARLPLDEPYEIPSSTVEAVKKARGRVIAIGTTVARALEHAASNGPLRPGRGVANQRLGPGTRLRVVDAMLSGTHEPGTSHYELLRAFLPDTLLQRATAALEAGGYLTHEFGDSVLVEAVHDISQAGCTRHAGKCGFDWAEPGPEPAKLSGELLPSPC